jgi:hypothetical protein
MNYRVWILLMASVVLMSGCATQGVNTTQRTENTMIKIDNEIVVPKSTSETWDILVKELSKSFYVINNIDKESRIINISFSTNSPSDYIDCGHTVRTYTQRDKTETYSYDTAASSSYKAATPRQPNPNFSYYGRARRETSLEGRSNIYVAPDEKDKNSTAVTVNTRYIWTLKMQVQIFAENINGQTLTTNERIPDYTGTIMFNTNQKGESNNTGDKITCFSKGKLEREILDMARGQSTPK